MTAIILHDLVVHSRDVSDLYRTKEYLSWQAIQEKLTKLVKNLYSETLTQLWQHSKATGLRTCTYIAFTFTLTFTLHLLTFTYIYI